MADVHAAFSAEIISLVPLSSGLAMLCQPGLAEAQAIASWDHSHQVCADELLIPTLTVARSTLHNTLIVGTES